MSYRDPAASDPDPTPDAALAAGWRDRCAGRPAYIDWYEEFPEDYLLGYGALDVFDDLDGRTARTLTDWEPARSTRVPA